ncbi:hypothetical protein R1flu_011696 [Riccia fluitans]|uniref:Uncharacterized protein n=1 Tax=Riccia fluitans TaxID=41844 RepID=A0ABD1Z9P3_9MARC
MSAKSGNSKANGHEASKKKITPGLISGIAAILFPGAFIKLGVQKVSHCTVERRNAERVERSAEGDVQKVAVTDKANEEFFGSVQEFHLVNRVGADMKCRASS